MLFIPIVPHCESEIFVEVDMCPRQNSSLADHCPWVHPVPLVLAIQLAEVPPSRSQGSHHTTQHSMSTLHGLKFTQWCY